MIIATRPRAKRSKCASSIGRLRPDALNSTMLPTAPTRHKRDEQRPVQMQRQQQLCRHR